MKMVDYSVIRYGVEVSLLRYHKGLLDKCLSDVQDQFTLNLLINDLPLIISRTFWPGLSLYADFMDEEDFSKKAVADLLERFFSLPRCCDVIGLYHIFWLGLGRSELPPLLTDDVLYLNMDGLSKNITSETFTQKTLKTFAESLSENNPVRKLTSLDSLTITALMNRCMKGGKWHYLFQLITASVLIALKGISRKVLSANTCNFNVKTNIIPDYPLFLHFDSPVGNHVKTVLGQKTPLDKSAQTSVIQLWEEYELCKTADDCMISEYPHIWFAFMQKQTETSREKWDKVYYPKLKAFASGEVQKPVVSTEVPPQVNASLKKVTASVCKKPKGFKVKINKTGV